MRINFVSHLIGISRSRTITRYWPAILMLAASSLWHCSEAGPPETGRCAMSSDGRPGNGSSAGAKISADGRYVAFEAAAYNLVPDDTNGTRDIFVRDLIAGTTTRASVSSDGAQANGDSHAPSISGDGRFVVFVSAATNLVKDDTNHCEDVFMHDRRSGATTRISVSSSGIQGAKASNCGGNALSGDGRYVAFTSEADNLVPGDTNGKADIFVRDTLTGTTRCVSTAMGGAQADGASDGAALSYDGTHTAFLSFAANLVPMDTNGRIDAFVHDNRSGETRRVSVGSRGAQGDGDSAWPSLSANGRYVIFESVASNLVQGDTNGEFDIFLHDGQTGDTRRVSVDSNGQQGDGWSVAGAISAGGRYVAFCSNATTLVADDTNDTWDVFVHDLWTRKTERVSVGSDLSQGNGKSSWPISLSGDGRYIAFDSYASNLVPTDTNDAGEVLFRGPLFTPAIADAVRALTVSSGLSALAGGEWGALNVMTGGASWSRVDIADAVTLAHRVTSVGDG